MASKLKRFSWLVLFLLIVWPTNISTAEESESSSPEESSQITPEKPKVADSGDEDDDDFIGNPVIEDPGPPEEFRTVKIAEGMVKGMLETSTNGQQFYSYYGVPYAKPPIGELRFKDPEFHDGWDEVLDATTIPPPCPQIDINKLLSSGRAPYSGKEDCLFLNIFHPVDVSNILLKPVMVFIHGGAFVSGSAADYEPYDFMDEDVILVVIQYRLGILGFSSTEDLVMPGNLGLKDQSQAIRWVQDNIDEFGGDPLRITIFGQGSGAASVHYQILSHRTIGTFRRAILQSGTALCPWAQGGVHRLAIEKIAENFKCESLIQPQDESLGGKEDSDAAKLEEDNAVPDESKEEAIDEDNKEASDESSKEYDTEESEQSSKENTEDKEEQTSGEEDIVEEPQKTKEEEEKERSIRRSEEILKCLQDVDAKNLTRTIKPFFALTYFPMIFGPIIDGRYIPETPEFLLKESRHRRLELIFGLTKDPGSFMTQAIFASEAKRMQFKYDFPFAGPQSMEYTERDVAPLNMSIKAFDHYNGGLSFEAGDANNISKMYSDRHLTVCTDLSALYHHKANQAKKKDVFFYELQHRGSRSFNDIFNLALSKEWIAAGDELFYLFPMKKIEDKDNEEDDQTLKRKMLKLWTNFAHYGTPTPDDSLGFEWQPFTEESPNHLVLKPEPYMEDDTRKEVREFWTSLPTYQNMFLAVDKIANLTEWKSIEEKEKENRENLNEVPSKEEEADEKKQESATKEDSKEAINDNKDEL